MTRQPRLDGRLDRLGGMSEPRRLATTEQARSGTPVLVVVARDQPALYEYLRRSFAAIAYIRVILDRREDGRSRPAPGPEGGDRGSERRHPTGEERRLRTQGYVIARGPAQGAEPHER